MLGPTAHVDPFTRNNLPPAETWPELLYTESRYPEYLNVAEELTDKMVAIGFGDHTALIGNGRRRTYKELLDWSNRIANVLVEDLGLVPGNRVLIRSSNNPAFVACWLAVTKAGGVAVNTMPMLRASELAQIVEKAEIKYSLCDSRLIDELEKCQESSPCLEHVVGFDGSSNFDAPLDRMALEKSVKFSPVKTGRDDVALLAFTSGTTGKPKATMHFHRDLLLIADGYAKEVLQVSPDDIVVGSPPLAFTFGLGGLAIFPLRFGASSILLENASPTNIIEIIDKYKATICFTAPTAYRVMLKGMEEDADLSSLRVAVSAGETLPAPIYKEWFEKTKKPLLDGIGATEMLHIFISNRLDDHAPGSTGKPISGYEAKIVNEHGEESTVDEVGRLMVRGPTGCRYLNDPRQHDYVSSGWNITGDAFYKDEQGFFHFVSRNDEMIVSSGYNIAGPEVESALLSHRYVKECAVIGTKDEARGMIVQAHIVLTENTAPSEQIVKELQDYVKNTIAPFKYPRSIKFIEALPKTKTGKVQKHKLTRV
ncbi:AMP-binding protein [Vibrio penaeicida]|uniref:AMP-binding protein n=1 Tax=Vibrio penaeicida TaxID=104609 RepID=UPI002734AB68|nr:AMP-binding protein [Vibrio penaeicida]MDP2574012.1 AMP-binding protein [Vibrio penaeicida]